MAESSAATRCWGAGESVRRELLAAGGGEGERHEDPLKALTLGTANKIQVLVTVMQKRCGGGRR